jgi:Xaa-Pro aminopeptidase
MANRVPAMFEARFQSFEDAPAGAASAPRVKALRTELAHRGLSGFVVPRADRHQNEYVPEAEQRLAWLTGFTGSAGAAVVLMDRAALFVDGRYTLQVRQQADASLFAIEHLVEMPPHQWLEKNLSSHDRLGYDPWLHTVESAERLAKACAASGAALVAVEPDLFDAIWTDRPAPPLGAIRLHDVVYAGEEATTKLARIRPEIGKLKADALVISDPHCVAWTFNIRGSDVPHTPLPLAFAIVPREGRPALYVDGRKLANDVRHSLEALADIREPSGLAGDLAALSAAKKTVRIDQATASDALARLITGQGGKLSRGPDPIVLMKAVKNSVEIAGAGAAHRRDGAAVVRFLAWLEGAAEGGTLSEIAAVEALESFRRDSGKLKDVSFPTIAGAGPDGAIVHYRVTRKTNRTIAPGSLFLVDSGAQYEDGTTDITRTLAVGTPTDEMRERFTRVLKGHIAIARAVFPDGTTGAQLDSFARQFLWEVGLDFDHGTGHGVGSYLSVHEGPARLSKLGTVPLKRGMILSNEPGYYKAEHYGIRIENLVLVIEAASVAGAEKPLNAFETLTLAPIDRRLVKPNMLTAAEIRWLDGYHARVAGALAPLLDPPALAWLQGATAPVAGG